MQNIPSHDKKIRPMFIPDPGMVIVGGDFSQQEPRVLAHMCGDQSLIETYRSGKDLYSTMAAQAFHTTYEDCLEFYLDENGKKILLKELKKRFPPEFLNRLNSVIYFNNLTDDNLKSIIGLEIEKTQDRLNKLGFDLEVDDEVISKILDIVKDEKEFGARPIARAIQDEIEDKITDCLLERDYDKDYIFKAYLEDSTVKVE